MRLVLGASGKLGHAMRRALDGATFLSRDELDLSDVASISRKLDHYSADAIINCAAFTDVDAAETREADATIVNCTAVGVLAEHAKRRTIPFITFSTEYVFDGTKDGAYVESDAPNPKNAYGRSKACGEEKVLAVYPDALVIRTSWLLSGTGDDFVSRILLEAVDRPVKVVDDQVGCPTMVDDLAAATLGVLSMGASGLLHVTNSGSASWFDLAVAAAGLAGIDPARISRCSTDEFPTRARRPANSVMASERFQALGLERLPHWRASLPKVVKRFTGL